MLNRFGTTLIAGAVLSGFSPVALAELICSGTSFPIAAPSTNSDTIVALGGPSATINDMNIVLDIEHDWVGDLTITITHGATSVVIVDQIGKPGINTNWGCSGDDIDATLDDEAATAIEDECAGTVPTVSGTFIPNEALSAFDGQVFDGDWTITVVNNEAFDTGTFNDWCIDVDTVPVTLSSFSTTPNVASGAVDVSWTTATELNNVGFELYQEAAGRWQSLSDRVPSHVITSSEPQRYEISSTGIDPNLPIALGTVDHRGERELFGPFTVGRQYGEASIDAPIDWDSIRVANLEVPAYGVMPAAAASPIGAGPVRVARAGIAGTLEIAEKGMYRVTREELLAAGINMSGVRNSDIAVTLRGRGVSRRVVSRTGRFTAGAYIEFFGYPPLPSDAQYIDAARYSIHVDRRLAVPMRRHTAVAKRPIDRFVQSERTEENNEYSFTRSGADPWYAQRLMSYGAPASGVVEFEKPTAVSRARAVRLDVHVTGVTDFPGDAALDPDHHVQVYLNDETEARADVRFDGQLSQRISLRVPLESLHDGTNSVRVVVPGDTGNVFDVVNIEHLDVHAVRDLELNTDGALFAVRGFRDDGFRVSGLRARPVGYLATSRFRSWELLPRRTVLRRPFRIYPMWDMGRGRMQGDVWISARQKLLTPLRITPAWPQVDVVAEPADYLIIAHPQFMPDAPGSNHPLNAFAESKRAEGYMTRIIDVSNLYQRYTDGAAVPYAISAFLREAAKRYPYKYVLLVGGDTYDYTDNLGVGSISYLPTPYASTSEIIHQTPSDSAYADLDGDLVPDVAIGRWPVRTTEELDIIVAKTIAWQARDDEDRRSALVIAEGDDENSAFTDSAQRVTSQFFEQGNWQVEQVLVDALRQQLPDSSEASVVARSQISTAMTTGAAVTVFAGHGAPTQWSYQSLVTPQSVRALPEGSPTTIAMPLACYTTYVVNPEADSLGHAMLFARDRGAVAVTGATVLSDISGNEMMAQEILRRMQGAAMTLGEAIVDVKRTIALSPNAQSRDLQLNWALLGDPSLVITRESIPLPQQQLTPGAR